MKYLKSVSLAGLVALAVMAVMGVGAASASEPKAEPTDGTFPIAFHGHGGHGILQTTVDDHTVTCTNSGSSGSITSASTIEHLSVTFRECIDVQTGLSCTTSGQAAGTIKTNTLNGTLVYLETNSSKIGLLLRNKEGAAKPFAHFVCGGLVTIEVSGEVLAEVTQLSHTELVLHFRKLAANSHPSPGAYLANIGCTHTSTTEKLLTKASGFQNWGPFASGIEGTQTVTLTEGGKIASTSCI
jgi:hypothetical protein